MNKKHKELPACTTLHMHYIHNVCLVQNSVNSSKILACLLVLLTSIRWHQHPWEQIHAYFLWQTQHSDPFAPKFTESWERISTQLTPSYLQVPKVSGKILPPCASTATPSQSTCVGYLGIWKQTMSSTPQIHEYLYKKVQLLLLISIRRSRVAQADSPWHSFSCR